MADVAVALDVPSGERALALVDALGETGDFYKVGLELYTRAGPRVVGELRERGKRVFLDLKLHDIPNTVAAAVRAAGDLEVELLTVHATGGSAMMEAAAEAASGGLRLVAVTLLTSLAPVDVESVWGREILSLRDEVVRLSGLAAESGIHGVVASPLEVEAIKRRVDRDLLVVTPGIRPSGRDLHDQARVATPAEAVRAGADVLVVGRPVTAAAEPARALAAIRASIEGVGTEVAG
ncbi:MAG: orotidine-5'-phosphate decarboxylase [Gemmatimonadetes bacterium]|nr:orotidine-5'-phosphate decarboxylase [Gemmatimonadota bacterium]